MERSHAENKKIVEAAKKANQEKYENHSKETLKRHIEKKFKTTIIGSLDKFEKAFGKLWGHDKYEDELTEEEIVWGDMWELVRTEVLNNGNNQLRAALNEIDRNTIQYNKFEYDFPIRKKDQ